MPTKYTFIRRLRRELTASPKKAAMLGLLLLVAVWFWAPLVGKWMGRKDDETPLTATTETATVTAEPMSTTATTIVPTVTLKQEAKSTWQQVLTWMRSDPKMKPHDPKLGGRDPFAPVAERLAAFNQRNGSANRADTHAATGRSFCAEYRSWKPRQNGIDQRPALS